MSRHFFGKEGSKSIRDKGISTCKGPKVRRIIEGLESRPEWGRQRVKGGG